MQGSCTFHRKSVSSRSNRSLIIDGVALRLVVAATGFPFSLFILPFVCAPLVTGQLPANNFALQVLHVNDGSPADFLKDDYA